MASTGLILGAAAAIVAGRDAYGEGWALAVGAGLGIVALGLGVAAVWLEWNTLVLAAFMASIGVLWLFEAVRNLEVYAHAQHARHVHA